MNVVTSFVLMLLSAMLFVVLNEFGATITLAVILFFTGVFFGAQALKWVIEQFVPGPSQLDIDVNMVRSTATMVEALDTYLDLPDERRLAVKQRMIINVGYHRSLCDILPSLTGGASYCVP